VTKIGELGTTQAATSNRRTLRRNILYHDGHCQLFVVR
jgi:prepilin-type processing-associated H-X9-DG protein